MNVSRDQTRAPTAHSLSYISHFPDDILQPKLKLGKSPTKVENLEHAAVAGISPPNYQPRLPLPSSCLDRIDAALYFYDRNTERRQDLVYLMSHGYVWA